MERSQKEDFRTGHVPKIQTETDKVCCQNSREENHQERKKKKTTIHQLPIQEFPLWLSGNEPY